MESATHVRHTATHRNIIIDQVSDSLIYVGYSDPGVLTGEAKWQIMRLQPGTGASLTLDRADGNCEFDNVWDDRASLSYS